MPPEITSVICHIISDGFKKASQDIFLYLSNTYCLFRTGMMGHVCLEKPGIKSGNLPIRPEPQPLALCAFLPTFLHIFTLGESDMSGTINWVQAVNLYQAK